MSDYYNYFFCQNNKGHYGFKHLHNEERRELDKFVCSNCEGPFIHNAENFHHFLLYWNEDSIGSKIDCGCWDDAFYAYTNLIELIKGETK
jgi:hypothetical protein